MIFEGMVETQNIIYSEAVKNYAETIEFTGHVTKFPQYQWKCVLKYHSRLDEMLTAVGMPVLLDTKYGNVEFLQ